MLVFGENFDLKRCKLRAKTFTEYPEKVSYGMRFKLPIRFSFSFVYPIYTKTSQGANTVPVDPELV